MPTYGLIEQRGSRNQRKTPRIRLNLRSSGEAPTGKDATVVLHNLSITGLLMESAAPLSVGNKLVVALPEAGDVAATVMWQSERLFGCRFDEPLPRAALSAAQLRNPVSPDNPSPDDASPDLSAGQPGDADFGESLAARLVSLRQARGLSRSALAARIGVSKPSIWAWEIGKTIPRRSSLLALAKAFGVSERELTAQGGMPGLLPAHGAAVGDESPGGASGLRELQAMLARKKDEIAALAGVEKDKVRIIVEF